MMRTQVHHLVEERCHSDAPALVDGDTTWSYADLWALVQGCAAGLHARGLSRGDRVAVYLDKRVETVAALLGTSAAGGVFVPVNPVLRSAQVAHILQDCTVRFLVTTAERLATLDSLDELVDLEHIVLVQDTLPDHPGRSLHAWSDVVDDAGTAAHAGIDSDLAAILYTSGSTGRPKGVVLTHRNLIVGAESVSSYLDNNADDVILSALPLSFDAGLSQLTTAFAVGARVVLLNYAFPRDLVRMCARHAVTGLTGVPPLWLQVADLDWPPEATQHLRYFANTGGRLPKTTLSRLRETFPLARPFLMYGLTEAFRSTYLDPDEVDRRPDSIGKAIPDAEILVIGPDGRECGPGEPGELVHRGPLVAAGYWGDAERTAARFRPLPGGVDTWRAPELAVWSGDTVVRDEDGFLFFVGRTDEMIKTSGYRVSPTEIEEMAYDSGLVRDAVAVGLPDERLGHRVVLVATPAHDEVSESTVKAALRRTLPLYMVPETVVLRGELPRSPNGKFDRVALREELS